LKKIIKRLIFYILKLYQVSIGNVLYLASKKYASLHTKLMLQIEWRFSGSCPSHFKHEINLYNWIYDTSNVEFIEWGAIPRMFISRGDNVLDLCCGDGSNAYLFFSDISENIDAIDYDKEALKYAHKYYKKNNINYLCEDLLTFTPPIKL
jgi:2-polyprenyl-3-methyl-5-hydroxy-6-metoxy-1,4-benzoquinol methylase